MNDIGSQCDVTKLRRYLAGELAAGDEDTLVRHLDDCSRCQREVESLAASAAEWDDVRTVLRSSSAQECLPSVAARPALHADETSDIDMSASGRRVDTCLDFLAPTDDPEMLGR